MPRPIAAFDHISAWEVNGAFVLHDERCPRACAHEVARFTTEDEALRAAEALARAPQPLTPCPRRTP